MGTENENTNNEGAENNEAPKHHSWIENIVDKIQKLDTEFPLSGGETEEDFESVDDKEEDETGEEKADKSKKTSFFDDLDTEFPLSGGEVDR